MMVPPVGLEPTLLAEPDFESDVSTNFTTEAWARIVANLTHSWRALVTFYKK